jgi:hypothetical protein
VSTGLSLHHGREFSCGNLISIRQFYLIYPKGATLSHLLIWPHVLWRRELELTLREAGQ